MCLVILLPLAGGAALPLLRGRSKRTLHLCVLAILVLEAAAVTGLLLSPASELTVLAMSDSLVLALRMDGVSRLFLAVAAYGYLLTGIYAFRYLSHGGREISFYAFFLLSLGTLAGMDLSKNLVTMYLFFEALTLLSMPLVLHDRTKESIQAALKYLFYSIAGAFLGLAAIFFLSAYSTSLDFRAGGNLDLGKLAGHESVLRVAVFLGVIGFGAKAGLYPLHGWLPTAHPVAPASASAVLSGIITKAGVLGILRSVYFLIGPDLLRGTWMQIAWMSLTLLTVFMGSLLAFRENLLKKRLAWSSVSQVSYVLFGLSTMHPVGLVGALLHVAAHALIKNTLFMSAGSIIRQAKHTRVDELEGIGKRMPVTMWCFTLVSVGLVGIPPCLGFVSKWYLAQGALSMEGVPGFFAWLAPAILLISALLTAGYLLTVSIRGFFPGKKEHAPSPVYEKCEAPWIMLVPMLLLTALSVILGIFPGALIRLFEGIAGLVM